MSVNIKKVEFSPKQKIAFLLLITGIPVLWLTLTINGGTATMMNSTEEPIFVKLMGTAFIEFIVGTLALFITSTLAKNSPAKIVGLTTSILLMVFIVFWLRPYISEFTGHRTAVKDAQSRGLDLNAERARPILEKANAGDIATQILVADGYVWGPDYDATGSFSSNGMGFPKDKSLAIKYYKLAIEQESAEAAWKLSLLYSSQEYNALNTLFFGEGYNIFTRNKVMENDRALAWKYLEMAAYRGDENAQETLGFTYLRGYSFGHYSADKDKVKAKHWLDKSAEQGNKNSIRYLKEEFSEE